MKKILLVLVVLVAALAVYWLFIKKKPAAGPAEKATALVTKRHSDPFNAGIDSLMKAYFAAKDAFVNADSSLAKAATQQLIALADSNRLAELKTETAGIYETAAVQLGDVKANAESLVRQTDLTEMRKDFGMIGENIYPLLKTIHYEGNTVYWQNCPMAFGEGKEANWLSSTEEVINPYLGKNHPEFKGTMLHCGEVKDSIKAQ